MLEIAGGIILAYVLISGAFIAIFLLMALIGVPLRWLANVGDKKRHPIEKTFAAFSEPPSWVDRAGP